MFGENHHDSIIQRGFDEALACQDMLARAPARPPLFTRVLARLTTAVRISAPRTPERKPRITRSTSLSGNR